MSERTAVGHRVERDAALSCAVAVACALGFLAFAAVPARGGDPALPFGLDVVRAVGFAAAVFLAPVVAGLAACVSATALGRRRADLSRRSRVLHLTTVVVALGLLVAYVASAEDLRVLLD